MKDIDELNWDDCRIFSEVVRAGSIRGAARGLGLDHATVSRRLANLEATLAVKLLVRAASGVQLTAAGEELRATTLEVGREIQSAARRISGANAPYSGRIRLSTHAILGTQFLIPSISEFRTSHPQMEVDLELSSQVVDLAMNQADVAVRVTNQPREDNIARRVSGFSYAVYTSRLVLSSHGAENCASRNVWVGWNDANPYPVSLKQEYFPDVPIRNCFPTIASQLEATASGLGLAALPCFVADGDPRLRRLSEPREVTAVFVLRHPDHRSTARVRAFYDHIGAFIAKRAPLLEGR